MASEQIESLAARLRKGIAKTEQILGSLEEDQWERVVYEDPYPWAIRDLLAHFLSAEESLLELAKATATGGEGLPPGFNYDEFNQQELNRLRGIAPAVLLSSLGKARQATLDWVQSLDEGQLQRIGLHPALGEVNLETMITAIYGHQLMHMRDVIRLLGKE